MKGFVHFIAKKYLWPETGPGGLVNQLNQHLGAEDVKFKEVKNLAGVQPPPPHQLKP